MSYRNDQEAALARLDVLEAEHARLLAENARLRSGKPAPVVESYVVDEPAPRFALWVVAICSVLAIAFIGYAFSTGT